MSSFIIDEAKMYKIRLWKYADSELVNNEDKKCTEAIQEDKTLILYLFTIGKEEHLTHTLYLMNRYGIEYLNVTYRSTSSFNRMLKLLKSYHALRYIDITFDTVRFCDDTFSKRNYEQLINILKLHTNLQGISVELEKTFPTEMMYKLLDAGYLRTVKFTGGNFYHQWYRYENYNDHEVTEFIKNCNITSFSLSNKYWTIPALKGLIYNTHIQDFEIHLYWLYNMKGSNKTKQEIFDLIDRVIKKNKTLRTFVYRYHPYAHREYAERFEIKYRDFISNSGLKIYVNDTLIR